MLALYVRQITSDDSELDIPNGENHAENEEEQEQPEVEEQEFYVEGRRNGTKLKASCVD